MNRYEKIARLELILTLRDRKRRMKMLSTLAAVTACAATALTVLLKT